MIQKPGLAEQEKNKMHFPKKTDSEDPEEASVSKTSWLVAEVVKAAKDIQPLIVTLVSQLTDELAITDKLQVAPKQKLSD